MRQFMKIVETAELEQLKALALRCETVDQFLKKTDGMDVLYRGHHEDVVPNDSFMTDYIGHAEQYGDGGTVDAFAVNLYSDVFMFKDDQFDQMRFALQRMDNDEFTHHYKTVLPDRLSNMGARWLPVAKKVIKGEQPFSEIAMIPNKNDAVVPLMQAWAASKGKNIIAFMGGDYGEYGGQMEFVVHDVSRLLNLRTLYMQVRAGA